MRRILMIAYDFPPMGGSGVQRTLKFAKYLPEFGWQPVILTVSNPPLHEQDDTLLSELPDHLPVYRTHNINLPNLIRRAFGRNDSPDIQSLAAMGTVSEDTKPTPPNRVHRALASFVWTWLSIPDTAIYWLPTALKTGLEIAKECDVIYSTSSPFTDHIVAALLHTISGKPWIADFRDPWTQYVTYQQSSRLRSRINFFLEKQFLEKPDLVCVTCLATARSFLETHPSLPEDKFIEITNGYDAEDFKQSPDSSFDKFTIVYTGRFNIKKNASKTLFKALKKLRCEQPDLATEIRVVFAGLFGQDNQALLQQLALQEMVDPVGYVNHQQSVKLLLKSHILLLTLNDEAGVNLTYPGKLFEYLAAQKTILALVPEGATADLIRNLGAGLVVPPDDPEAICEAILDLYHRYQQDKTLARTYSDLERFERRRLTQRLARHLDDMS